MMDALSDDSGAYFVELREYPIEEVAARLKADEAEVRKAIDDLTEQINALELKHGRIKRIVIMDD